MPSIRRGDRLLIVAHANSLRSLIKRLDGLGEAGKEGGREGGREEGREVIESVKVPNGRPFVYWFDEEGGVVDRMGRRGAEGRFRGVYVGEERKGGREGGREGAGKEEEEEGGVARRAQELFLMGREEEVVGEGVKERRRGEGR